MDLDASPVVRQLERDQTIIYGRNCIEKNEFILNAIIHNTFTFYNSA